MTLTSMQRGASPSIARIGTLEISTLRRWAMMLALGSLVYLVLMGTNPMSDKVKTVPYTGDGDIVRQIWYSISFLLAVWAIDPLKRPAQLQVFPPLLLIFFIWCWISLTWAIEPSIAMRRLALTTIVAFTLFASVRELGYDRVISLIRWLLVLNLVMNYVALAVTPVAIHGYEANDPGIIGDWRGVMAQKNFAGAVCVLTLFMFLLDAERIKLWIRLPILAAAAYFLYRTHAKTSEGLLALSLPCAIMFYFYNPRYRALAIPFLAIFFAILAAIIAVNMDAIHAFFNDPQSLTGRVQIWPRLLTYAQDNWLLGTGFGSYWNIGPRSPAFIYSEGWVAGLGNGHNGYLDLLTQLGFPAVIFAVFVVVVLPIGKLIASMTVPRGKGALMIAMMLFCSLHNFTETSLFDRDAIIQVFLMLSVAMVEAMTGRRADRLLIAQQAPSAALATTGVTTIAAPRQVTPRRDPVA